MCGGEVNYHLPDDRRLEQIILDDDDDGSRSLTPEEEALLYRRGREYAEAACTCSCSCKAKKRLYRQSDEEDEPIEETKVEIEKEKVELKREIDLIGAILVIVGSQIGSGIFVSPKGVLRNAGSVGFSMIIWAGAGVIATIGALCYAEVGTLIPKSGGEYPILREGYKGGHALSFIFAWTCSTILKPSSFAILSLTFAKYAWSLFGIEAVSLMAEKSLALACIWLVVLINSLSVKLTQQFLKFFGYGKLLSLGFIIIGGLVMNFTGRVANADVFTFSQMFQFDENNSIVYPEISIVGIALYQGLWAYDGWNQLNYISGELKNPANLPRAIMVAMFSVTCLYLLTNYAYLSVLGMEGLLAADAVGTSFAQAIYPGLDKLIPIMVASSVFGTALISCFTASRIPFVAACDGEYPAVLSMLHKKRMTPVPAVLLNGILASLMIFPNDFNSLVNYFSFCMWLFHTATCFTVIIFRWTRPVDLHPRQFKVPLILPVLICIIGCYLIAVPFFQEFDMGYLFALCWIIFGFLLRVTITRVTFCNGPLARFTQFVQRVFQVVPEGVEIE